MNARRAISVTAAILGISLIWGGVAIILVISQNHWWAAIPAVIWLMSMQNLQRYYTRTHPAIIEADENATKGLTLQLFLLTSIFSLFFLLLVYFGAEQKLLLWLVWPFVFSVLFYIILRQRRFRENAREALDELSDVSEIHEKDSP